MSSGLAQEVRCLTMILIYSDSATSGTGFANLGTEVTEPKRPHISNLHSRSSACENSIPAAFNPYALGTQPNLRWRGIRDESRFSMHAHGWERRVRLRAESRRPRIVPKPSLSRERDCDPHSRLAFSWNTKPPSSWTSSDYSTRPTRRPLPSNLIVLGCRFSTTPRSHLVVEDDGDTTTGIRAPSATLTASSTFGIRIRAHRADLVVHTHCSHSR
ncbi:unnamed protein product [Mycena citricolor]|uniref:Uncharacterized protein n=1 Tax=Mycena citricolor TaxID=2018698 RepID=A0AAD2H1F2_9AGAR|nr:unnamed protein product [Mycena citricolor]